MSCDVLIYKRGYNRNNVLLQSDVLISGGNTFSGDSWPVILHRQVTNDDSQRVTESLQLLNCDDHFLFQLKC